MAMSLIDLEVKCYSGHIYAERPKSFKWQGIEYNIEKIGKSWLEPGERHFELRTAGNKTFHLCYNERQNRWSIIELVE